MKKIDAIKTLLEVDQKDLEVLSLDQLRDVLGSLRYTIRQIEREVMTREMHHGMQVK